jgi:2-oxoisovalerate dehydrogenase E1 component
MAHSKGDDDRNQSEVEEYWKRDDLAKFLATNQDVAVRLGREIEARIDRAVALAQEAPYAGPVEPAPPLPDHRWQPTVLPSEERVVQRINFALGQALAGDERVILIGEDLEAPYGGAFKATKDLSERHPRRVLNAPISESAIVGVGSGLALGGRRPVCEIMFGDFLGLAFDQIVNSAAKFQYMYNDQVSTPVVIRTPMGGKRGYGPTHSQSLEKHFLGIPGTQVIAVHHRFDPARVYENLFATIDRPTIVVENKLLYGKRLTDAVPQGFHLEHTEGPFPTTRLRPDARPDLTILCYGGMLSDVEEVLDALFEDHDLVAEVVVPTRLYPLELGPILESVAKSGRLLTVEEGLDFCAFGAEVVAQIGEQRPGILHALRRLAAPHHPIPSAGPLEKALLPGPALILDAALALVRDD